jgi:hypothetical protein
VTCSRAYRVVNLLLRVASYCSCGRRIGGVAVTVFQPSFHLPHYLSSFPSATGPVPCLSFTLGGTTRFAALFGCNTNNTSNSMIVSSL